VDLQASGRRWSLSRLPDQVEWVLATTTPLRAGTALDGARLGRLLGNLLDAMSSTSFRVRRFLPELQDFETAGLEVTRPWRAVGVRQLKEGEAGGFRKLIVGKRLPASEPPEYQARIDAADVPPFTLGAEIPDLLEEITRYLAEVTVGE
jgi:hypothetical protein